MRKIISLSLVFVLVLNIAFANAVLLAQDTGNQALQGRDVSLMLQSKVAKTYISDGKTITESSQINISKRFVINLAIDVPVKGDFPDTATPDSYVLQGDYALIELSENLIIPQNYTAKMEGSVVELNGGDQRLQIGDVEVLSQGGKDYVKLIFNGHENVFNGTMHSVKLQHEIELKIDKSKVIEENNQRYITLFGKKIPLEQTENLELTKSGRLDKAKKQIHWTIEVTRTDKSGLPLDLSGYVLEEDFSELPINEYTHQTLHKIERNQAGNEVITELEWDGIGQGNRLRYTLPQGSQGALEFRLTTQLTDRQFYVSSIAGKKNGVRLYSPAGEELLHKTFLVNIPPHKWIQKGFAQEFQVNGQYHVTWEITINLEEQELADVKIEDVLPADMTFVSAEWKVGTANTVNGKQEWSYQSVGNEITSYPQGGIFSIGDINKRYQLLLTTSVDMEGRVSKIFSNTASVKWGDGVVFTDSHSVVVGDKDLFRKSIDKDTTSKANLEWNFVLKATKLNHLQAPKVYDLLVFRSDIKKSHLLQADKVSGLPQGIAMKDVLPEELYYLKYRKVVQDGSLQVTVYPINYDGVHIADLVEISGDADKDWAFQLHTLPMDKHHISFAGDKIYKNTAGFFEGNKLLTVSTAEVRYAPVVVIKHLLNPDVIPVLANSLRADLVNQINQILPPAKKDGYHAKERKILFRIDVNPSEHGGLVEGLGVFRLVDNMPEQLEFTPVTKQDEFLVYKAKSRFESSDSGWRTDTLEEVTPIGEPLSLQELADLGIKASITEQYGRRNALTLTFSEEIEEPLSIVVAGRIYAGKLPELLKKEGPTETSNMVRMVYDGPRAIAGVNSSPIAIREVYRDILLDVNPLKKQALLPKKNEERDGIIKWEVLVDTYHVVTAHSKISVQDKLGAGMRLKTDRIEGTNRPAFVTLKEFDDAKDTTPTEVLLEFGKEVDYNDSTDTLTVHLPRKDKRYQLNYTTEIKRDDSVLAGNELSNQVSLVAENIEFTKKIAKYQVMNYDVNVEYKKNGILEILKTDDSPQKNVLPSAEFTLTNTADNVSTQKVTDENGYIRFIHLKAGSYLLRETKAPDGFVLSDKVYTVEVKNKVGIVGVDVIVDGKEMRSVMNIVNQKKVVPPAIPLTPPVPATPIEPKTPLSPYTPEEKEEEQPKVPPKEEKKPEPPKVEIPMTPLVPATPTVKEEPKKPVQPVNPNVPRRPRRRIPGVPYDELEDGDTPFGDPNSPLYPWDEDGNPKKPISDSPFPYGNGELPKTDGIPLEKMMYLGLFLFGTGTLLKKKK